MGVGGCKQYKHIIAKYDWDVSTALVICELESSGVATASNWKDSHNGCNGSHGLFQVGCVHGHTVEELYDPEYNTQVAYELWKERGWQPWSTYKLIAQR